MAQAVMTGYVAFGYSSDTSDANATTSGMGVDDAEINFAIAEDIGGVGKLSAGLGFISGGRGDAATGRDTTIKLTTASGTAVTMGTTKGASYLTGGVAAVGTNYNWDLSGKLFSDRTTTDAVSVKIPLMEGVSVSVAHSEAGTGYATGSGAAGNGTEQRYNTASLDYAAGALAVNAGYRAYDNTIASDAASSNTRNRASASYDLGIAKIGAGYESTQYMYGNSKTDSLLGVNLPVGGALSLGVQFAQQSTSGNASSASNYNRNGYLLGMNYTLSKQTYLAAHYYSYDGGTTVNPSGYGVFLYKGF